MTTISGGRSCRREQLHCFGSTVTIRAEGREPGLLVAMARARAIAFEVQRRLSRFDPARELCRLNADPRERVPASGLMRRFAVAVADAGKQSGGLVDATCLPAVEAAGYWAHWDPGAEFAAGPPPMILAKTAILAGPEHAARVLVDGGAIALAGGVVDIVPPAHDPVLRCATTSAWTSCPRTRRNPDEHITAAST